MKKISAFLVSIVLTTASMAQSGAMTFVGKANFYVTMNGQKMGETNLPADTIIYSGKDITFPSMTYNGSIIPSFTVKNTTFSGGMNGVSWPEQTFEATAEVDGQTKTITGTSLSGTYSRQNNIHKLNLSITFKYGNMPMPTSYTIEAYYVKAYTDRLDVSVGGMYNYPADAPVTYNIRTYEENGATKLDVAVPAYVLKNTAINDINVGSYTVKGLTYSEEKGGYYRDYANDGITMQFSSTGGIAPGEYALDGGTNGTNIQDILVKVDGKGAVTAILNQFKVGKMPFQLSSSFPGTLEPTEISILESPTSLTGTIYDLNGCIVKELKPGIYIQNGKKIVVR